MRGLDPELPRRRSGAGGRAAVAVAATIAAVFTFAVAATPASSATNDGEVFSTDFSEHPVGPGVPDGWRELFASSFYEVAENPSRLVKTSFGDPRHVLAWEEVGEVEGDVEVATLIRQPESTLPEMETTRYQVHLHASGSAGAINSYAVDDTGTNRQGVRIRRSVDHSQSTRASTNTPFSMNVWHNVVLQRRGDAIRAKVWPYFTEEPDEWTVEAIDTSLDSGRVGLGYFGGRMTQEFAWFSVGTGDQDAQRAPAGIEGIEPPQVPSAPSVSGEARDGSAVLGWDPVAGADHYQIERDGELIAHGWENPSYADPNLDPAAVGSYRVRGISALEGAGPWSEPIDVRQDPLPEDHLLSFETDDDHPFTHHDEELEWLDELAEASPRMGYEVVGHSGEGRPVHLVRIGKDGPPTDKELARRPTAWISGGNHGDEVGARQGVFFLLRDLALSHDSEVLEWLDTYTFVIVPTINPDGVAAGTRRTTTPELDSNRDFVRLESNETRNVTKLLRDIKPQFVIDAHEWAGSPAHDRGELEIGGPGNANLHPAVQTLSDDLAFGRIQPSANESWGWRSSPYQEQYGQPSRLRQIGALKHAPTFLTESNRNPEVRRLNEADVERDDPETNLRRVSSQRWALNEAMRFITERVDDIVAANRASLKRHRSNTGPLYTDGSKAFPPGPEETLDPPPCGWIVDDIDSVADVLRLHGIKWEQRRLPGGERVSLVPAAQSMRAVALAAVDPASPERLDVGALRVTDSGWCRRGGPTGR